MIQPRLRVLACVPPETAAEYQYAAIAYIRRTVGDHVSGSFLTGLDEAINVKRRKTFTGSTVTARPWWKSSYGNTAQGHIGNVRGTSFQ